MLTRGSGELFYHLKTSGRFAEPRARLYAAEICSAVHHLHTLKIIYRDLKPENVKKATPPPAGRHTFAMPKLT